MGQYKGLNQEKQKTSSGLGKALINKVEKQTLPTTNMQKEARFVHAEVIVEEKKNMKSIIDQNDLTEYIQIAELEGNNFETTRGTIVKEVEKEIIINNMIQEREEAKKHIFDVENNKYLQNLRIPRKPKWTTQMKPEELNKLQNQSFLTWRRNLAQLEEEHYTVQITPYEKNIEVWRQLWRVIQRSDVLVQIVDGRDTLFFRCEDIESYVRELGQDKQNLLLINKSDLIAEQVRISWNQYLIQQNVNHIFFSAQIEQQKIDEQMKVDEEQEQALKYLNTHNIATRKILLENLKKIVTDIREQRLSEKVNEFENLIDPNEGETSLPNQQTVIKQQSADFEDLTDYANFSHNPLQQEALITIGMVGYPNVGKSSVVNALCNKKLVGVAAMPGKTKHFQTIFLEKDLLLCDCPGLVFPNASSTRAQMVCNGVLPIDQIKDYLSPMQLIVERIPKIVLDQLYSLKINWEFPSGSLFLQHYSQQKGYVTGRGLPDEAKAAKLILQDFVNGKLLFCKLHPEYDEEKEGKIWNFNVFSDQNEDQLIKDLEKIKSDEEEEQKDEEKVLMKKDINDTDMEQILDHQLKIDNFQQFDDDDLINLMQGKKIQGVKLTQEQRREIKFAMNRGEEIDFTKILLELQKQAFLVKNKNMPPSGKL